MTSHVPASMEVQAHESVEEMRACGCHGCRISLILHDFLHGADFDGRVAMIQFLAMTARTLAAQEILTRIDERDRQAGDG